MQKIIDSFLTSYGEKRIAIYGTGLNAERVLTTVSGYRFECVISNDEHLIGETFFDREIVGLQTALEKVDVILIAAVPVATRIVFERIKEDVPNDIPIFDMMGICLNEAKDYENHDYWKTTKDDLIREIDAHDVISFDIFDTLLTRAVLYPETIFKIVSIEMKDFNDFFKIRKEAERRLYKQGKHPKLQDIYDEIANKEKISRTVLDAYMDKEIELEHRCLRRREHIFEAYKYALDAGKRVFLTSDMYLNRDIMIPMLVSQEINDYEDVLISCEEGCDKGSGKLFYKLKKKTGTARILHIGNDRFSDIQKATESGVDSFYVPSGVDLLLWSSAAHVISNVHTVSDEILLGMIIADVFNSPFILGRSKGKILFDSIELIAKICVLPITMSYISWMVNQLKERPKDIVLFASRDGYLLHKIYSRIKVESPELMLPEGKYFYTSRKAISESVVKSEADIDVFCSNLDDYRKTDIVRHLEKLFGVSLKEELSKYVGKCIKDFDTGSLLEDLKKQGDKIYYHAGERRKRYLTYLGEFSFENYERIHMVDLIAQGSSRYGLSSLLGREVFLLALGTTKLPNAFVPEYRLSHSLYGAMTTGVGGYVSTMFNLLELAYASQDGQLWGFQDDGTPYFDDSTKYNAELLNRVQICIGEYVGDYPVKQWFLYAYTQEFAESMLGLLNPSFSDVSEDVRGYFDFYDPLDEVNEEFNVMDMIRGIGER